MKPIVENDIAWNDIIGETSAIGAIMVNDIIGESSDNLQKRLI